jgi:hypothetical protein
MLFFSMNTIKKAQRQCRSNLLGYKVTCLKSTARIHLRNSSLKPHKKRTKDGINLPHAKPHQGCTQSPRITAKTSDNNTWRDLNAQCN